MSATNTTTTYQLPIFVGSDVPSWLTDWNGAMTDIDTAIAAAKTTADGAALTAGNASSGVATNANAITALQTTVGNHTTAISNNAGSINTINSLIGNGTPTTTDQTIIGAINEINAAYKVAANVVFDNTGTGMVATNVQTAIVEAFNNGGGSTPTATQVTYDNTGSGLVATDVQDAIDELNAKITTEDITVSFNSGISDLVTSLADKVVISAELLGCILVTNTRVSDGQKTGYSFIALSSSIATDTAVNGSKTVKVTYTS